MCGESVGFRVVSIRACLRCNNDWPLMYIHLGCEPMRIPIYSHWSLSLTRGNTPYIPNASFSAFVAIYLELALILLHPNCQIPKFRHHCCAVHQVRKLGKHVSPHITYYIMLVSKTLSSTAVLILADEALLEWQDAGTFSDCSGTPCYSQHPPPSPSTRSLHDLSSPRAFHRKSQSHLDTIVDCPACKIGITFPCQCLSCQRGLSFALGTVCSGPKHAGLVGKGPHMRTGLSSNVMLK